MGQTWPEAGSLLRSYFRAHTLTLSLAHTSHPAISWRHTTEERGGRGGHLLFHPSIHPSGADALSLSLCWMPFIRQV